jgi:ribosomal protein S2
MDVLKKAAAKRNTVLFVYVKATVKSWVKKQAKKHGCTESLVVDTLLTEAMGKNVTNPKKSV